MVKKEGPVVSAKTKELKRRITQTFELPDYGKLQGLPERLRVMGYQSTAVALEELIESDADQNTDNRSETASDQEG